MRDTADLHPVEPALIDWRGDRHLCPVEAYAHLVDLPVDVDHLRQTFRDQGVVFALLFGSHVDGRATPASDVDVAIWAPDGLDLWRLGGLVSEEVDLVDLATAPDGLSGRIAMTGVVLLDDDPPQRIRWQSQTRKRYLDEAGRREQFRRDFVAAHG